MAGSLLLTIVALTTATADLETVLKFDTRAVRRGDVAYCEVRVLNRSHHARTLPALAAGGNVWFEIELVGPELQLAGAPVARWPTGGGALIAGFEQETVPIGGSIVTWAQVPLFTANALRQVKDDANRATVTGIFCIGPTHVRSQPMGITIEGEISRAPNSLDLVRLLYVPYDRHPEMNNAWHERLRHLPQLRHIDGLSESPWTLSIPSRLNWLQGQLDPDSTMHRCVSITRCLQECVAANENDKREAITVVIRELERCGPAERQWFIRYVRLRLAESIDFTSERLFKEALPASTCRYEVRRSDDEASKVNSASIIDKQSDP